jgi:hypothetical protein
MKVANRWPTVVFISLFTFLTLVQVAVFQRDTLKKLSRLSSDSNTSSTKIATAPVQGGKDQSLPKASERTPPLPLPKNAPLDLNPPLIQADPAPSSQGDGAQAPLDLSNPQNVTWVQSRLRELGFLRGTTNGWDSFSRSALRDLKSTNNLAQDDQWDLKTQELLTTGPVLRADQTFVGAWSENACVVPGAKPDIYLNSRRAVSSGGGICEFTSIKAAGSAWNVATLCTNAGESWKATIRLMVIGDKLIWTGRDGTQTQYHRCQQ